MTCQCDYTGLGHPIMNPLMSGRDAPSLMADIYPYPPWAFPLMSGLMGAPTVITGSEVKIGFEYGSTATSSESMAGQDDPGYMRDTLMGMVYSYGLFSSVNVNVQPPAYAGLQHGYILIQGVIAQDFGSVSDLASAIGNAVASAGLPITITRQDALWVLSTPSTDASVQQPFDPNQQQQQNQLPGQKQQCNWSQMSFGDYIACQLGITSPLGGVAVGSIGALAGLGVLTVLAVVLLKR